jgi:5-enolpyruvylshikimate-3-phosphate synthase
VADIEVRPARLKGIAVPERLVALAIDEFPAFFIAAACAEGETLVTGAEELRVKESDRIAVMAEGLTALGVTNEVRPDGLRIEGGPISGGTIDSRGDHRIAMSFAVASLRARGPIEILDTANVATSFPGFAGLARSAGLVIEERA